MNRASLVLAAALLAGAAPGTARLAASDHLVAPSEVDRALLGAAETRQADLARVEGLLAAPAAERAAEQAGLDLARVRAGLPSLSDADLRDLAQRAARLDSDPTAGRVVSRDVDQLLVIFLVVAIVILVLKAVD